MTTSTHITPMTQVLLDSDIEERFHAAAGAEARYLMNVCNMGRPSDSMRSVVANWPRLTSALAKALYVEALTPGEEITVLLPQQDATGGLLTGTELRTVRFLMRSKRTPDFMQCSAENGARIYVGMDKIR